MQINRLESGGRIDRNKPLTFQFDGRTYRGYVGDTLASALLANGVSLIGRSFKLHRPRGIVGSGAEEPNAIFQVETGGHLQPNLRATQVELYEGLIAKRTKGWPSLRFDVAAINNLLARVFSAGFYYKTFMRPKFMWRVYEHFIRRSAGFSRAPAVADEDRYEHRNAHCDVLIAGAGPAGLMAALAAAKAGARVLIADEQNEFGGRLLASSAEIDGLASAEWVAQCVRQLARFENVTLLPRATVFGYYDHNFLAIAERLTDHVALTERGPLRQRLWRVRARQVISAQGAFERPLVFCNNDRPGVMLASAVLTYIKRYGVLPGRNAVVFTNNDSAYATALELSRSGASVVIVDSRPGGAADPGNEIAASGITILPGHLVTNVKGKNRINAVRIAKWTGDSTMMTQSSITIDCDLLTMSGGWSPAVHLHSQSGGTNRWDDALHCFVPDNRVQANRSAGACRGSWSLRDCLRDGLGAGNGAIADCDLEAVLNQVPKTARTDSSAMQPLWRVPADQAADVCAKQFLDFQNDTSVADIRLAVREGYRNIEHVKRYTALGFGTDQGKLGNINGMAVLAECLGRTLPEVGTTTFRPAYTPVTFGAMAGANVRALFDPVRITAIHAAHEAEGAYFEVVGQWLRPWYFPRGDEDLHAAVARECLATRASLGIMDASTLGKIDVQGPDATEFLERIYTHNVGKMKIGRCAYGVMLGEDGMLMDDGVMARLDDQHYYLTTTTGGAANVLSWLELWLQTEWPELNVYLTSLTDHYSTIAVVGPNSRRVLEKLGCSADLSRGKFPFMSVQDVELAGVSVQLFRVSFSGELAFEVNIDSNDAAKMWQRISAAGAEFDITVYGTETMHVLRAEKGFVIIGQDTDGTVTPVDAGMSWLLSKEKDFLGKRSLTRADCQRHDRKQLVGLLSDDGQTVLNEGAQLVVDPEAALPVPMCGHVSSSYNSACLGRPLALALLEGGRARRGEALFAVHTDGKVVPVKVVSPVFYDAKGERQND